LGEGSGGQTNLSDDGFFTNPVVKGFYKNHIKVRKIEMERERERFCFIKKHIVVCTVSLVEAHFYSLKIVRLFERRELYFFRDLQGRE
jgi:hypothetical protein